MAKTYIPLNTALPLSQEIVNLRNLLALVRENAEQLKLRMDTMVDGSDYADIETRTGCGTGNGSALYALVATNVRANINVGAVATSLDQFVARVGG
jgi:hypothetical protein